MYKLFFLMAFQISVSILGYGFTRPAQSSIAFNEVLKFESVQYIEVSEVTYLEPHIAQNRNGIVCNNNPINYTDPLGLFTAEDAIEFIFPIQSMSRDADTVVDSGASTVDRVSAGLSLAGNAILTASVIGGIAEKALYKNLSHFTDDVGKAAISKASTLEGGRTYLTRAKDIPKGATSQEVEKILEIGSGKGKNSITARVARSNLKIPEKGPTTSGGAYQRILKRDVKINPKKFKETQ